MSGDDRDLHNRFSALRREEEAQAPAFHVPSRHAHSSGPSRPWLKPLVALACLAVSVAAVLWLARPGLMRPRQPLTAPTVSIADWTAPTDFLLDTPGGELLRTVPAFGTNPGDENALKSGPKSRPQPWHRHSSYTKLLP